MSDNRITYNDNNLRYVEQKMYDSIRIDKSLWNEDSRETCTIFDSTRFEKQRNAILEQTRHDVEWNLLPKIVIDHFNKPRNEDNTSNVRKTNKIYSVYNRIKVRLLNNYNHLKRFFKSFSK